MTFVERPVAVAAAPRADPAGPMAARSSDNAVLVSVTPLFTRRIAFTLGLILLLAAAFRFLMVSHAPAFLLPGDSADLVAAGYSLAEQGRFILGARHAPAYPALLAVVISLLGPQPEHWTMVQHVLGLTSVILVYLLGALTFGRRAGLLAALGVAVNGTLLLSEHTLAPEAIFAPLLLLSTLLLVLALRSPRLAWFLPAGLAFGFGALAVPMSQGLLVVLLGLVSLRSTAWRPRLAAVALFCLGYGLVVGPWLLRNQVVHGVAAVSTGLGESLFDRLRLHDPSLDFTDRAGGGEASLQQRVFELAPSYTRGWQVRTALQREDRATQAQADAALLAAGLQVIGQEPGRYLLGTLSMFVKLGLFSDARPERFWQTRQGPSDEREWPAPVRSALESAPPPSEVDRSTVAWLTGFYQDPRLSLSGIMDTLTGSTNGVRFGALGRTLDRTGVADLSLVSLLFLFGTVLCLATRRPTAILLPGFAVGQLLLYAALDGPTARYRYPLQPLITLVAAGGLVGLVSTARGRPSHAAGWLRSWQATIVNHTSSRQRALFGALLVSSILAFGGMEPALRADTVQDDLRQWGVWLIRLGDGELLRGDVMAEYYQAIAPPGYSALYWILSWIVDPLLAAKLLPPLLGLLMAGCTFFLVLRLHPSRVCAFLAAVLVSWYAWRHDDLASGTPRAFALPLIAGLSWALAAERLLLAAGLVALAATLYPVIGVLGVVLIGVRLVRFRAWRPTLSRDSRTWVAFLVAGLLAGSALVASQRAVERFGPLVSAAEARSMPEFSPNGRIPYFEPALRGLGSHESGFDVRVSGAIFPQVPLLLEYLALAALLPVLLLFKRHLPMLRRLGSQRVLLLELLLVSLSLFGLAHLLFFHLYHPSRYVKWSVPFSLAIAGGLALGILLEALAARIAPARRGFVASGLALGFGLLMAASPVDYNSGFKRDSQPLITAYLQSQPKDILVGGLLGADSVPVLTGRRVFVSREHALPYHLGYYAEVRRRTEDLVAVYYAEEPGELAEFAVRHGIDLFLVNREAYRLETFVDSAPVETLTGERKRNWEPFTTTIVDSLTSTRRFALLELADRCAVVDDGNVALVPTSCLHSAGHSTSRLQEAS